MEAVRFLPPTLPALRWLADVGADLPPAVQVRLRNIMFGAVRTLVFGTVVSIATTLMAYGRSGNLDFAIIAAIDSLLLPVRIMAWRREMRPTDLVFVGGLLWALLISATVFLVIVSHDLPMSLLAIAWSFASISGIVGRNFLAPRYAMAQVGAISLGMAAGIVTVEPNVVVFVALLSVFFIVVSFGLIRRQREMTIQVITSEMESRAQSFLDPLTGLLNRRGLEAAFGAMAAAPASGIGLLCLDLDGFKQVNDKLGHGTGDKLLTEVARRLTAGTGTGTKVCRLGGDEFLVLVPRIGAADLHLLGTRIIASVATPYRIDDNLLVRVGASVGAVVGDRQASDLTRMMIVADNALYAAKAAGKGRCILHDSDDETGGERDAEPVRAGARPSRRVS